MHESRDHFIICGLGRLGQQTLVNLSQFGQPTLPISVVAIDRVKPVDFEFSGIESLLAQPVLVGDCRRIDLLRAAGIEDCRALLIMTRDESVNIETAMLARRFYPAVHLVIRSSRQNLNELLQNQLGHFVALNAAELPAETFALAGMDNELVSVFTIDSYQFRVIERRISPEDSRYAHMPLYRTQRRDSRILTLQPQVRCDLSPRDRHSSASTLFHGWSADAYLRPQDQISYIEADSLESPDQVLTRSRRQRWYPGLRRLMASAAVEGLQRFWRFWQNDAQASLRRITGIAGISALILCLSSTVILKLTVSDLTWFRAFSLAMILIFGGYGDVFGGLDPLPIPSGVYGIFLLIALASLVLVLSVFGFLIDELIRSRFDFLQRRPRLPRSGHIIVVGTGRLGYRILQILHQLNQSLVCITHDRLQYPNLKTQVPLLEGEMTQALKAANLGQAKSIIAVTDDPILNLELALMAQEASQTGRLTAVVRSHDQYFTDSVPLLLARGKAFSLHQLSAEAFAGAAFGEKIISLFQLQAQTILVTEYCVEAEDTLVGKLLAEISYGYGVVPILLKTENWQKIPETHLFPSDDYPLRSGDRLYVLASIEGLRRIERAEPFPPKQWQLEVQAPLSREGRLEVGNILAQMTGLDLSRCRAFADALPTTLQLDLYDLQAQRVREALQRWAPTVLRLQSQP
ncbi:potassium channel family protein [Lyngbya confervoides]|uniref:NAD-binding protein n=1 Tax=Lyngbya confervoides BDU141951 TaxID=1574623 RepID=A0ABD4T5X4_9CYAN|nr:potassium channel protein [Lyngbya confervoides]MCM1983984.1 NAD-binding protein [Lyngbya confervoides BDU141951]